MTVSTTASSTVVGGNGATTVFSFSFIAAASSDIQVIYTNTSGIATTLSPSQYTLVINPIATGQIWGIGGTVTYPLSGPPIANGASLTIQRIVPLTQTTTISNQGDFSPEVIESALDTLEFQIQQVSARGGQMRGTWVIGTSYNFGDLVQDGINGNNSGNFYVCVISNTSGVWTTDLAAGDWTLAITAVFPTVPVPVSVPNGGTGLSTYSQGDVLYADTTSSLTRLPKNAVATRYLTNTGTSNNPAWGQVNLANGITGTLAVANGGTGVTSSTGTGNVVLSSSPVLVTPTLGAALATSINFGGANSLSNYDSGSFVATCTGAISTTTTIYWKLTGNVVSLTFSLNRVAGASSANPINMIGQLPTNLRPTDVTDVRFVSIGVTDAGSDVAAPGMCRVLSSGNIIIYKDGAAANFASSASTVGYYGFSVSYSL